VKIFRKRVKKQKRRESRREGAAGEGMEEREDRVWAGGGVLSRGWGGGRGA
jgi:hypothetical protein